MLGTLVLILQLKLRYYLLHRTLFYVERLIFFITGIKVVMRRDEEIMVTENYRFLISGKKSIRKGKKANLKIRNEKS